MKNKQCECTSRLDSNGNTESLFSALAFIADLTVSSPLTGDSSSDGNPNAVKEEYFVKFKPAGNLNDLFYNVLKSNKENTLIFFEDIGKDQLNGRYDLVEDNTALFAVSKPIFDILNSNSRSKIVVWVKQSELDKAFDSKDGIRVLEVEKVRVLLDE